MKKKITILIPCYNEQESLPSLYESLIEMADSQGNYVWEFLFINDGSTDNTLQVIKHYREIDSRISYLDLSRNFGKECAMLAGFDYAKGDAVVIMDADLQHPAMIVPQMITKWEEGYDDVYGQRINRGKESWSRKVLTRLFYYILQKSARYDVLPNVGDFRLLDKKCIKALRRLRENERYTKGMYAWIGFRKTSVMYETHDRYAGHTSFTMWGLLKLAVDGITSSTIFPLRLSTIIGLIVSLFSLIYIIYMLYVVFFVGEPVAGHPTLIISILFMGGLNLIFLGVLGEYLGRIFMESKNRPVYLVNEYNETNTK